MALTTAQKTRVRAALHRAYSTQELPTPWTKPDADEVITDTDDWLDGNQSSYVTSLGQPYQGSSSAADKALLFITVAIAQRLVSAPEHTAILRSVLAELADIQGA